MFKIREAMQNMQNLSEKKLIKIVLVESEGLKVWTKHGTNGRVAYPVT